MAMVETMKGEKEKVRRMDRVGGWRRGTGEREAGGGKEVGKAMTRDLIDKGVMTEREWRGGRKSGKERKMK